MNNEQVAKTSLCPVRVMYDQWVMDVSHDPPAGDYCFCPIEGESIVIGLNMFGAPQGKIVGAFAEQGQDFVDSWWERNAEWFKELQAKHNATVSEG